MNDSDDALRAAEERFDEAGAQLDRLQLVAKLCEKEGLAYASLTDDHLGPMLVTYQHKPIGQVHTTSPSALRDWHARPYTADGSLGDAHGPYVNARAAAASLLPGRQEAQPKPEHSG
ncbi:hypothetical protein [Streptomyces sp. NPDC058985]|uniref:hypothetical protein n=1 Tax=Streptomyces sp. NPDC058985 TaxID=3346684 RepID=UPI00368BC468